MSRARSTLLAVLLGAALGCGGHSPTSPQRTEVLNGNIVYGQSSTATVTLNSEGNLRATLDNLTPVFVNVTTFDPSTLRVELTLGAQKAGSCVATGSVILAPKDTISYGLPKGDYCITVKDSGTLPPDGVVAYSLRVVIKD